MNNSKIEKSFSIRLVKLICLLGIFVLVFCAITDFIDYGIDLRNWDFLYIQGFITNFLVMIMFIFVFHNPQKVEFLAIVSFMYAFVIFLEENYYNVMGLFMYYLTVALMVFRGFYHHKKKIKILFTIGLLLLLQLTNLRFGMKIFINSIAQNVGYSLVLFCILFFLFQYQKNKNFSYFTSRILDLSDYDENQLSAMDKEWLEMALTNEKYDAIARKYGYSEGHIKKRMRYIFATIDVIDRIDLFSKYAGCKVIKNKEELQQWKQKFLETV